MAAFSVFEHVKQFWTGFDEVRRVLALQEENRVLKRKLDKLRDRMDDIEEEMEHRIEEVRRANRHELILRSQVRSLFPEDR